MNREKRIRDLRALIADPATFEGERATAREMLARLDGSEPDPAEHGRTQTLGGWEPWYYAPPMRAYVITDELDPDAPIGTWEGALRAFRRASGDAQESREWRV